TDAQRGQSVAATTTAQLVEECHDETGAAHAERMADRDRTAVHVHELRVEAELADDHEALRGECLVQLDEVDVGHVDAGALEQLPDRRNRADAHHARVDSCDRAPDERAEWLRAERLRLLLA